MTHITPHNGDRPDANRTPALRAEPRHFIKRRNERGSNTWHSLRELAARSQPFFVIT